MWGQELCSLKTPPLTQREESTADVPPEKAYTIILLHNILLYSQTGKKTYTTNEATWLESAEKNRINFTSYPNGIFLHLFLKSKTES